MTKHKHKVNEFLKEAAQFQLGDLPTESSHPKTTRLSILAQTDLISAIRIFQEVEIEALEGLLNHTAQIDELKSSIEACLQNHGRIFFCGCGATGRLSLSLETNWRESLSDSHRALSESVFGFIAGGDYALVKSIENFEDHPEYGARQLLDLGFTENDLLISCTEGGETPFVIGATLKAAEVSRHPSYFLFCNSKESLRHILRSQSVFKNPKIKSWSLAAKPQAICGSTRLQASSVLYLACGIALFGAQSNVLREESLSTSKRLQYYLDFLKSTNLSVLQKLVEIESRAYLNKEFLTYHLDEDAMPILTDLTERSPTFNLLPVENEIELSNQAATTNLCIDLAANSPGAWKLILKRQPRTLSWPELGDKYNLPVLLGFDFSASKSRYRNSLIANQAHHNIRLDIHDARLDFILTGENFNQCSLSIPSSILERNLFLKLIFNLVSTLSQCRNNRVLGNIMLYVKPSNKKLIDRAARFTKIILRDQHQITSQYEDLIDCVFSASETLSSEESVVLKSVDIFLKKHKQK